MGLDDRLISLEAAVVELRVENNELSSQAESVLAGNMDEQLIRGELGLAQPGETVVIIPDDLLETDEVALPDSEDEVDHRPVWRKWFELLFWFVWSGWYTTGLE